MNRRSFLGAALGLVTAPIWGLNSKAKGADRVMSKDIVMLHGANAGGWCFDDFAKVFEAKGFTCHAPDLIGHGENKASAMTSLAGIGIADYRSEMEAFLEGFASPPVLLGHSMGAVIAQQLAAQGLARSLILVSPAPRAGILPPTSGEKQLDQDLMGLGAFWKMVIPPDFALACIYSQCLLAIGDVAQAMGFSLRDTLVRIGSDFVVALVRGRISPWQTASYLLAMALAAWLVWRRPVKRRPVN